MSDEKLRYEIKMLKAFGQKITYKEIAEYLQITYGAFLHWLNGQYNFSTKRKEELSIIISNLS